jgi:hypothetical protein
MKLTYVVYKLYSADLRRHLEIRAPYLEAAGDLERLKSTEAWHHRPSVITDAAGNILESNQIDVAHVTGITAGELG